MIPFPKQSTSDVNWRTCSLKVDCSTQSCRFNLRVGASVDSFALGHAPMSSAHGESLPRCYPRCSKQSSLFELRWVSTKMDPNSANKPNFRNMSIDPIQSPVPYAYYRRAEILQLLGVRNINTSAKPAPVSSLVSPWHSELIPMTTGERLRLCERALSHDAEHRTDHRFPHRRQ